MFRDTQWISDSKVKNKKNKAKRRHTDPSSDTSSTTSSDKASQLSNSDEILTINSFYDPLPPSDPKFLLIDDEFNLKIGIHQLNPCVFQKALTSNKMIDSSTVHSDHRITPLFGGRLSQLVCQNLFKRLELKKKEFCEFMNMNESEFNGAINTMYDEDYLPEYYRLLPIDIPTISPFIKVQFLPEFSGQQQHHQEEQSSQSLGTNATATSTKEIISLLPKCNESVKNNEDKCLLKIEVPDLIENIALHFRQTGRPGYLHQSTATSTKNIISLLPKCNESVKNNEVPDLVENTTLHFRQTGRPGYLAVLASK
ncbi:13882_t:CDS:2 [Rhizophagus irregularis]|nr:13882_t:CDS:2 [Rhizophagus irregularis]